MLKLQWNKKFALIFTLACSTALFGISIFGNAYNAPLTAAHEIPSIELKSVEINSARSFKLFNILSVSFTNYKFSCK